MDRREVCEWIVELAPWESFSEVALCSPQETTILCNFEESDFELQRIVSLMPISIVRGESFKSNNSIIVTILLQ